MQRNVTFADLRDLPAAHICHRSPPNPGEESLDEGGRAGGRVGGGGKLWLADKNAVAVAEATSFD